LSKIEDYLADNLCVPMLSEVMRRVQEESGRRWEAVPELGISEGNPRPSGAWTGYPRG
jgi:hypothetical protein